LEQSSYFLQPVSPLEFTFVSNGPNGQIVKRISFKPFPEDDRVFNLGLVDERPDGTCSDITVSDNKDLERVIGSVALVIRIFLKSFPDKSVFITGSTVFPELGFIESFYLRRSEILILLFFSMD
jgi:hypothetical protein